MARYLKYIYINIYIDDDVRPHPTTHHHFLKIRCHPLHLHIGIGVLGVGDVIIIVFLG